MKPTSTAVNYHILGESYVDHFCFLKSSIPQPGCDSTLHRPVTVRAGGSTMNTATHLQHFTMQPTSIINQVSSRVIVQTVLNESDEYGKLLCRHAENHSFAVVNCNKEEIENNDAVCAENCSDSTPHCVVIVSNGERSFMTHRGCGHRFTADSFDWGAVYGTTSNDKGNTMSTSLSAIHVHIAGYYCTPGFWNGSLYRELVKLKSHFNIYQGEISDQQQCFQHDYELSLVTQYDVSEAWDGGLDDIIPLLSYMFLSDGEASKIVQQGKLRRRKQHRQDDNESTALPTENEIIDYFVSIRGKTWFIVTKGKDGVVAFRGCSSDGNVDVVRIEPAIEVLSVDPTGAGDAFVSGFLYAIWKQQNKSAGQSANKLYRVSRDTIQIALRWGCVAGGASVTVHGASVIPEQSIIDSLCKQYGVSF